MPFLRSRCSTAMTARPRSVTDHRTSSWWLSQAVIEVVFLSETANLRTRIGVASQKVAPAARTFSGVHDFASVRARKYKALIRPLHESDLTQSALYLRVSRVQIV